MVHVILVPYPTQGHVNPMLQFGKRLAWQGHRVTMAAPRSLLRTLPPSSASTSAISLKEISDGYDDGGVYAAASIGAYLDRFRAVGSTTLASLVERLGAAGTPVHCIVYDPFLAWALDAARALGLRAAAFLTQAATVCALYWQVRSGKLNVPVCGKFPAVEGGPEMERGDAPSFLTPEGAARYPAYQEMLINQFNNLSEADAVLINSFHELEPQALDWFVMCWPMLTRAIGPTIPSAYLDNRIPDDTQYGLDFTQPDSPCLSWLDTKPPGSVVYVSFGSLSKLGKTQIEELAFGLKASGKSFIWVVKNWDACHLPEDAAVNGEHGLVVSWSPQLPVLAHDAVGCFVTHCGWNSTIEAVALGIPVVAVPQWTDQPTNAWLAEGVWGVGVRARSTSEGVVEREELQRCVQEVSEWGPRREEIQRNARRWRDEAIKAVSAGGSSDRGLQDFVDLVMTRNA